MPRVLCFINIFIALSILGCGRSASPNELDPPSALGQREDVQRVFESDEPYSPKKLDSTDIEQYLKEHEKAVEDADAIRRFYETRDRQFAWFVDDSLSESARSFLALIASEDTMHTKVAKLRDQLNDTIPRPEKVETAIELELALTTKFFGFASKRYEGIVTRDLKELEWYIPKRKKNYVKMLDSLANGKMDLAAMEPLHPQYFELKRQLKLYHDLTSLEWDALQLPGNKPLEVGDSAEIVPVISERLKLLGDLEDQVDSLKSPMVYDSSMVDAIKRSQQRHGLVQDGIIGPNFLEQLNVAPAKRLWTILLNMERLRWMPEEEQEEFVLVNIPEYKMHVIGNGKQKMSMEVVVGTAANNTIIFSDTISYIVFSPTWTLPQSIVQEEILPEMEQDPDYLKDRHMEIIGGTEEQPLIQQKPGGHNSLGRVKFMFPNSHSIYLHDTPAKSLFDRNVRAFSHGCIRISEPTAFAEYLLRNDDNWTLKKIQEAMSAEKEVSVGLKDPLPVMITYLTAWVDDQDRLQFRDDIYGHDERLGNELFSKDIPNAGERGIANVAAESE